MQIIARLESLRSREHTATVELVETLVECQRTRAHVDAGYDSLWKLLVARLGYSPAAASRRMAAVRCVMKCPRALEMLRERRTTLSALHAVAKTLLEADDPASLLDAIDGASHADVERVVARCRPDARPVERIRRKVVAASAVGSSKAARPVSRSTSRRASTSDAELPLAPAPTTVDDRPSSSDDAPACEERVQLTLSLSAADFARLQDAKRRLSGKYPRGMSLEQLFLELIGRFEKSPKARRAPATASEPTTTSRHVPVAVRRAVFERDGSACTYVAPDGSRCGSQHDLEVDHVQPWARGGTHAPENLRVLCAAHNRRRAEREFGRPWNPRPS